jgi:hypothetical protein
VDGVRVEDCEAALHQDIDVVDLGAVEQSRITAPTTSATIRRRSARKSATLSSMRSTAFNAGQLHLAKQVARDSALSTFFSSKPFFVAHVLHLPSKPGIDHARAA